MKRKYWYICHVHACPVCGGEKRYRERVYEEPDSYWQWEDVYDYCLDMGWL